MDLQDYHRSWAEISLDAVEHNLHAARARIPASTKLMTVIKADGYGHGALALARFLRGKCDYFAVAVLEEALSLRKAGIAEPILLLGYTSPSQSEAVVRAGLTQTVFCLEAARALSAAAVKNVKRIKIHIAVDTGMSRIGFADTQDAAEEIVRIAALPGLELEGIFTHFARADEADKSAARLQASRFADFTARLEEMGIRIPIKHICNSAGIIDFEEHLDMVRLGISLYGLYPSEDVSKGNLPLRPAMTWKTHVVQLKTVPPGCGVSYGHSFITRRKTRIATLPVGYADGYPRALSNRGRVIIRGQYAPVLGRVCMDQCMVDVTDIPGVAQEEEVLLLGSAGSCRITLEEIGAASASFNYETACRVGQRVPRVYIYRGQVVEFHSMLVTAADYLNAP
ncbi:MAG: alanine racemase [Oscillospiraceae bacterium]|jgi:alanine racemase|nr:alanine racemase [Oscillospiraceae bacterium]